MISRRPTDAGERPFEPVGRVAVVGPGGAGKSTLARELGRRTGIPVVHLDEHYWKPGWVPTAPDAWRSLQEQLLGGEAWIADGNYGSTLDVRLARADLVLIVQPARWRCVVGVLRRLARHRGQTLQAPGCPEHLDLEFLRWVWRFPRDSRCRIDAAISKYGVPTVELRSRRDAKQLLQAVPAQARRGSRG